MDTADSEEPPAPPPSGLAKGLQRALSLEPLLSEPRWAPGASLLLNPRRLEIVLSAAVYPGIHLRSASKLLVSPLPSLRFHVTRLEKAGLLRTRRLGSRLALFLPDVFPAWAEALLAAWQEPLDRQVLLLIEGRPGITAEALSRHLVASPAVLGAAIGRLTTRGAVRRGTREGSLAYSTTARWEQLRALSQDRVGNRLQSFLSLLDREGLHPTLEEASTTRARLSLDGPRSRIRLTLPLDPLQPA